MFKKKKTPIDGGQPVLLLDVTLAGIVLCFCMLLRGNLKKSTCVILKTKDKQKGCLRDVEIVEHFRLICVICVICLLFAC